VLWVIPLLCLTAGAVLVTAALRQSTRTAVDLRDECARLGELRTALVDLRQDADRARSHVEGLGRRGSRNPVDR
jgi:hypothetical protein